MNENLQAVTECPVCLETFVDPRNLKCGHSLCLRCIAKLTCATKLLVCPECRQEHGQISKAEDVPRNLSMQTILDNLRQRDMIPKLSSITINADSSPCACEECGEKSALDKLLFCPNHSKYICHACCLHKHKPCVVNTCSAKEHFMNEHARHAEKIEKLKSCLSTVDTTAKSMKEFCETFGQQIDGVVQEVQSCTQQLITTEDVLKQSKHKKTNPTENSRSLDGLVSAIQAICNKHRQLLTVGSEFFKSLIIVPLVTYFCLALLLFGTFLPGKRVNVVDMENQTVSQSVEKKIDIAWHVGIGNPYIIETCPSKGVLSFDVTSTWNQSGSGGSLTVKRYQNQTRQQLWTLQFGPAYDSILLTSMYWNMVLSVTSTGTLELASQRFGYTSNSQQEFRVETIDKDLKCRIVHCATGKVLEYNGECSQAETGDSEKQCVVLSDYSGRASQHWRFTAV